MCVHISALKSFLLLFSSSSSHRWRVVKSFLKREKNLFLTIVGESLSEHEILWRLCHVNCEDKKNVSISSPPPYLLRLPNVSQLGNQQILLFLLPHYQIRSSDALKKWPIMKSSGYLLPLFASLSKGEKTRLDSLASLSTCSVKENCRLLVYFFLSLLLFSIRRSVSSTDNKCIIIQVSFTGRSYRHQVAVVSLKVSWWWGYEDSRERGKRGVQAKRVFFLSFHGTDNSIGYMTEPEWRLWWMQV